MAIFHRHRYPSFWAPQRVPTEPFELDYSHPDAQGLIGFWPLAGSWQEYGHNGLTLVPSGSTTWSALPSGPALTVASGSWMSSASNLSTATWTSGTVIWGMTPITAYNAGTTRGLWSIEDTGANQQLAAQVFSDNNWYVGWYDASTETRASVAASTSNWTVGVFAIYACTWSPANGTRFYRNGVQLASNAGAPHTHAITQPWRINAYGATLSSTSAGNVTYSGMRVYAREFTPAQILRSTVTEPYALLRPVARRAYRGPPPAGPPTGALNLTQDSQTLAATGTVPLTSGTLNLTQANQTLSAAGGPVVSIGSGTPVIPSPSCVLLLHTDGLDTFGRFIDSSPSVHFLTATSTTVSATAKFGSGAASFNSSSAYIDTNNATDFNFGAGQFTIEAWVYLTGSLSSTPVIAAQLLGSGSNNGWSLYLNATRVNLDYSINGTSIFTLVGTYTLPSNTWVHIAVDRDASNNLRFYANGTVLNTITTAVTFFPSTQSCLIGNDSGLAHAFAGYLDEIRITKGRAMYGGAFTPPTSPFSVSNTVLLVHADGTNGSTTFIDSSMSANTLTAIASAQISTTTPKFGTGAVNIPTNLSAVDTGNATDFNFNDGPFTIDAWVYPTSLSSAQTAIISQWTSVSGNLGWKFVLSDTTISFIFTSSGSSGISWGAAYTVTLNTWTHIAIDREPNASQVRFYVNGVQVNATFNSGTFIFPSTLKCQIGNDGNNLAFPGYLDEIRVSKGVARFNGNFTPPATAYLPDFTVGITQSDQTLSAAGTVATVGAVTGTLTATQANQTLVAAATLLAGGTLARTQADQTLAATGALLAGGALNTTEALDTIVAAGGPRVTGTLNVAQAPNTILATAGDIVAGAVIVSQAAQTLAATGTVPIGLTATLGLAQAAQALVAAGGVLAQGALSQLQASHTLVATGASPTSGGLNQLQANHTLGAFAGLAITGRLTRSQTAQTLIARGSSGIGPSAGGVVVTQEPQSYAGIASLGYPQDPQTLIATGIVGGLAGILDLLQASQILLGSAFVVTGFGGNLARTQDLQTLVAAGTVAGTASSVEARVLVLA